MEIIIIVFTIFIGIICGIITGLIPGIHINLISMVVLVNSIFLFKFFSINEVIIFIISMGVVHTFVDFIPSLIFGIPSTDTALSVLPGHKLVLEGKAYEAIFLSSIGSFAGMIFAFLISPLAFYGLKTSYEIIKDFIPYLLLFTIISLILLEKSLIKKFWATIVVLFAGGLGSLVLNTSMINNPLLILFTGIFGISSIIYSLLEEENQFPEQKYNFNFKFDKNFLKAIGVGGVCSTICSISPGIGNAQAGTLASLFFKNMIAEIFIVVLSAINTINFILSFITFYLINRARNGSVFVISQLIESISTKDLFLYFFIIFLVSIFAFGVTMFLGKIIIKNVCKFNIKIINFLILGFLFFLIFLFDGINGILFLVTASFLGMFCLSLNVRRVHLMGVLLIPVIFGII